MKAIDEFNLESILIFSDEIDVARGFFDDERFWYMTGNTTGEDLYCMSRCGGVVMSASSYSWWGSYLSDNKSVGPDRMFPPGSFINNDFKYDKLISWVK